MAQESIERYWAKSGIFPMSGIADLFQVFGKLKRTEKQQEAQSSMFSMFADLSAENTEQLLGDLDKNDVTQAGLEDWLDVEGIENMLDGMIEDAMDLDEMGMVSEPGGAAVIDGDNEDDDCPIFSSAPLFEPRAVTAMFADLEEMCFNCNLPRAAVFLRLAKRAVEEELPKRVGARKQSQMQMSEMWRR